MARNSDTNVPLIHATGFTPVITDLRPKREGLVHPSFYPWFAFTIAHFYFVGQRHFELAVWALAPVFSGRNRG